MGLTPRLLVLPAYAAGKRGDRLVLTQKWITGMVEYQKYWSGPVHVLMEQTDRDDDNLDHVVVRPEELPFALNVVRYDDHALQSSIRGAAVALLAVHHRQQHLVDTCAAVGVPAVYGAEYSLKTRLQILRASVRNPLLLARRSFWELGNERRNRRTLSRAAGVQCNGTPTYDAYRSLNRHAMLYFDTRVDRDMVATEDAVVRRFAQRRASGVRRLAFSGRLIAMKGADHLVRVADALRKRQVRFELSICGAGELEPSMKREVAARGLEGQVRFLGNLDFATQLVPFIRDHVDVFVCCHRQGDPSCTYLETMACGVPILGYDNEAFAGLLATSQAGWDVPMDDPEAMAARLSRLSDDELERHSLRSLAFAREHTFEREFQKRVEHLVQVSTEPSRGVA